MASCLGVIGTVGYSIYLQHQPLLSLLGPWLSPYTNDVVLVAAIVFIL